MGGGQSDCLPLFFIRLPFTRYCEKAKEHWSDIEIVLKSMEPPLEMHAHFLVRDRHLPLVDLLRSEVENNFQAISEQK